MIYPIFTFPINSDALDFGCLVPPLETECLVQTAPTFCDVRSEPSPFSRSPMQAEIDPAQTKALRAKAVEYLEVALTLTSEINAPTAGCMIEMALYNLRADERPEPDLLPAR